MLKRLDWLYLKGQDGGASSDSDSDTDSSDSDKRPQKRQVRPAAGRPVARRQHSGSEEEEVESSEQPSLDAAPQGAEPAESDTSGSDEGEDEDEDDSSDEDEDARPSQRHARMRQLYADSSEEGSEGGEGDPDEGSRGRGRLGFARSLDDISDPDEEESEDVARGEEESEDAGPSISASDVIQAWESDDVEAQNFKGLPLRCTLCNVLLLNRVTYLQHVSAKKHQARVKQQSPDDEEAIQLAEESNPVPEEEEAETHTERAARMSVLAMQAKEAAAAAEAEAAAGNAASRKGKKQRKDVRVRPGRNQRAALKAKLEAAAAAGAGDGSAEGDADAGSKAAQRKVEKLKRALHNKGKKQKKKAKLGEAGPADGAGVPEGKAAGTANAAKGAAHGGGNGTGSVAAAEGKKGSKSPRAGVLVSKAAPDSSSKATGNGSEAKAASVKKLKQQTHTQAPMPQGAGKEVKQAAHRPANGSESKRPKA